MTAEPVTRPVVDTTAAGDSFAAAYIAARLNGAAPVAAAMATVALNAYANCVDTLFAGLVPYCIQYGNSCYLGLLSFWY